LADILTSISHPIQDIGFIVVHFAPHCEENGVPDSSEKAPWHWRRVTLYDHPKLRVFLAIAAFAPFWWRFWQCLRKTYDSKNYMQLVNALKYLSKMAPIAAVLMGSANKWRDDKGNFNLSYWIYFTFQILTTFFCLYWDYVWDWGLLNGCSETHRLLRISQEKMSFSPTFYYVCMVENFMIRFWWLFASAGITFKSTKFEVLDKIELLIMIGILAELTRRLIWSILRVENEFYNNFE
jgi:hypothetical protein